MQNTKFVLGTGSTLKMKKVLNVEYSNLNGSGITENSFNIKSSGFNVSGIVGTVYLSDIPNQDKQTGSIFCSNWIHPHNQKLLENR